MTPAQFAATYLATAQQVSQGTGIDPVVLLAQWANETSWATSWAGAPNNLGNIRCSPTTFCQYATVNDFAQACIATFHNGLYQAVLTAVGPAAQLAAIVASPWSAQHYGGSLAAFYDPLVAILGGIELTTEEHDKLEAVYAAIFGSNAAPNIPSPPLGPAVNDLYAAIFGPNAPVDVTTPIVPALRQLLARSSTVDLSPVLTALNGLTTRIQAIEANLNAPRPPA